MPKDLKKDGTDYVFTTYLHLSREKGVRATKTPSGSYAGERLCKVNVRVPMAAFTTPSFEIDVGLTSPDFTTSPEQVEQSIKDALAPHPVVVTVSNVNADGEA